ncbi:MAG TPA: hypothetical protein VNS63_18155, partial [Blastocatellia bacterium]|nr:hypothetical protein [Blastocatellia bacterium]
AHLDLSRGPRAVPKPSPPAAASRPTESIPAVAVDFGSLPQRSRPSDPILSFPTRAPFERSRQPRVWSPTIIGAEHASEDYAPSEAVADPRVVNPSFRIAAAAIVIALVLFCVVTVYIIFSGGRRRPPAPETKPAVIAENVEQPPFIPTPPDALDYKDQAAPEPVPAPTRANEVKKTVPAKTPSPSSIPKTPTAVKPKPVLMDRPSSAPREPVIARPSAPREATPARVERSNVEARLVRVRSMRIASGVRYDLTFDLQDESGRHAQWERMQIWMRSASGVSRAEAIPFVHRLGAGGALTFTISVDFLGHSPADWQGRVVCTTIGSDNDGRALRASFGTNLMP